MSCKDKIKSATTQLDAYGAAPLLDPGCLEDKLAAVFGLMADLSTEKADLEALQQPYRERIEAVKADQSQALAPLKQKEAALSAAISHMIEKYELDTLTGGDLQAEVKIVPDLDKNWLKEYLRQNPDSFLSGCVRITPVVSFIPAAGPGEENAPVQPEGMTPPEKMSREQKITRNEAIMTASRLVEKGFAMIDTETTGMGKKAEVVSISVVGPQGAFYSLVKPTVPISPEAEAVHGISMEQVSDAPAFDQILPQIQAIAGDKALVAYNADFDSRMIVQSARACGVEPPPGKWTCAMRLYQDFAGMESWSKLSTAAASLGINPDGMLHNAETDARLAYQLVERMAQEELVSVEPPGPGEEDDSPVWNGPDEPAERQTAARRVQELLETLSTLRAEITEQSKPFDTQIRAIGKEMKIATGDRQKAYEDRLSQAKTLVSAMGQTIQAYGATMAYSRRYTWDFSAIHSHMEANPQDNFCIQANQQGYSLRRAVAIKKHKA